MPELPEVETIRRQLEHAVAGRKILDVEVPFAGRMNVPAGVFMRAVKGSSFAVPGRRAKLLLLHLSNGWTIVIHLKMTGRLLLGPAGRARPKHTHVVFSLAKGEELFFEDTRKFGYVKLVRTEALERDIFDKEGYGPEPLEPGFTAEKFAMCIRGRGRKKIKPLLMEQTCIAGVGNIYADEACWIARVHPERRADTLTDAELRELHKGVVGSMTKALEVRGSSADMFRDLYGQEGENVPNLAVYERQGKPCRRCRAPIEKYWLAGRGTHFCPKCQKAGK